MIPFPPEQMATAERCKKKKKIWPRLERERQMNLFGRQKAGQGMMPLAAASLLASRDLRFFLFNWG